MSSPQNIPRPSLSGLFARKPLRRAALGCLLGIFLAAMGDLSAQASPALFVDFSSSSTPVVADGTKATVVSNADIPAVKEIGGRKALAITKPGERMLLESNVPLNKPISAFVVIKVDDGKLGADTASRIVVDASGNSFYEVFRIQWIGRDLILRAGHSLKSEPTNIAVTFAAEETEAFKGKWVIVGFSMKEGEGWGCIGEIGSSDLVLKRAQVVGGGRLAFQETAKFSLGAGLNGEPKSEGGIAISQFAVFRNEFTPEQMVGLCEAVQAGKALNTDFAPAAADRVASLLSLNKPDQIAAQKQRIATSKMILEFEDGWLVKWENLETGERVDFGKPDIARSNREDRHYLPGPWWVDWKQPADLEATRTQWKTDVKEIDPTAVEILQSGSRPGDREVHALQWGVQVPYDKIDAVHFPKGMPPTRMAGKDLLGTFLVPSGDLGGRLGHLGARGDWRLRFYQLQGKTGGLLIYMDDPELDHYAALEFKKQPGGLIISNRSISSPPWKNSYTGGKWVVQQYTGYVGAGAQFYQDYLAKAFHLIPLKDRPTGWAKKLGMMFVNAPWTNPLPLPGKRRPEYNYSTKWQESIKAGEQWLDNLAKVMNPDQVMIYTVDWKAIPHIDRGLQDNAPDPFFVIMCQKARARGFHVMLHTCVPVLSSDSVTYERYFKHQAKQLGLPHIQGHVIHALQGRWLGDEDATPSPPGAPGSWTDRSGFMRPAIELGMNPAFEGYRYVVAASLLMAIKATGADAVHLDVPNPEIDLRSAEYGMNGLQGYREFGKLLRGLLDESGLKNVAIGTEVTPSEALLPYVDFAQTTRGKSIAGFVDGIATGKFTLSEENMIIGQHGAELERVKKIREQIDAGKFNKEFNPEYASLFLKKVRELGEPNINNMVIAPYVQAMPHLGQASNIAGKRGNAADILKNQIVDSLTTWSGLQHDTPPFFGGNWNMFMDIPPYDSLEVIQRYRKDAYADPGKSIRENGRVLNKFDYGKFALARFWADQTPQLMPPGKWARSDIALYSLKDGRQMRVYRRDPQTLRLELSNGETLAELDLFAGWKNAEILLNKYQPTWLRNQIDEYFVPPPTQ